MNLVRILADIAGFVTIAIGRLTHSDLSLFDAAFHVGGMMGFGKTLLVFPRTTLIPLSAWSRASCYNR